MSIERKVKRIGPGEVFDRVTMHFVREHCTVIEAAVQCDIDGIAERSHR